MSGQVPAALRRLVRRRASGCCEYCRFPEEDALFPHGIDHIIARKHRGETSEANLAWACFACNAFKGTDLTSIDTETGRVIRLFNPRKDRWTRHFRLEGALVVPLTPRGRVTEYLLRFNLPWLVQVRRLLIRMGRYPCPASFAEPVRADS